MSDADPLPEAARAARDAYEAMERSKQAHFGLLQTLEEREAEGGYRSEAERRELERLLAEHDARVAAFRSVLARLRIEHPADFAAFVGYLSEIGSQPDGDGGRH